MARSDGLLLSSKENYPNGLLRNRMTRVTVTVHGLVAETVVYQEFVNDWHDSTDAVYSFPLPPDARATKFLYWRNDTTFKAVLRVQQQATNPGTGESPLAARINRYIGRNGIKIELKGIAPGKIQRVALHYVSLCDYFQGEVTYRFPLATGDFITHPLDHLQFDFHVSSNSTITGFDLPSRQPYKVLANDDNQLRVQYVQPKSYINSDLVFQYRTDVDKLGVDFYSAANDSIDGHFALFIRPQNQAEPGGVIAKRILFLLGSSSRMLGYKLTQSIEAISRSLDLLNPSDEFNIVDFNYRVLSWKTAPVPATPDNIQQAKSYLAAIVAQSGSRMDLALQSALAQIKDDSVNNAILVFTDGRSPIDPRAIAAQNTYHAGIFMVGIGDDLDRARMEMTAALNYGFVTYLDETDILSEKMVRVFKQISQPILKNVGMEFGRANVYAILPPTIASTYAGSYFFNAGRYKNSGISAFSIAGYSSEGVTSFDFQLDFTGDTHKDKFVESLWAKEAIDALEHEIEVYGETPALKDSLISISLRYGIRCRYTAYIADYTEVVTGVRDHSAAKAPSPVSFIIGNYPNPFNPTTTIQFYLGPESIYAPAKFIKIYNSLGQLVWVIDLSQLLPGFHSIVFAGRDALGRELASGVYFVRLEVGREISARRIVLAR
jgi:Ca-activated chloride channel family protein